MGSKVEEWEQRHEDYLREISSDDHLDDTDFVAVCEDLADRAQTAADAKKAEMGDDEDR